MAVSGVLSLTGVDTSDHYDNDDDDKGGEDGTETDSQGDRHCRVAAD